MDLKLLPNSVKNRIIGFWSESAIRKWKEEDGFATVEALLKEKQHILTLLSTDSECSAFTVVSAFMEDLAIIREAKREAESLLNCGKLIDARVGQIGNRRIDTSARRDVHLWLRQIELTHFPSLQAINSAVIEFIAKLNVIDRTLNLSYDSSEVQLAYFSGNSSHFVRHKDATEDSSRFLTVIVYLNSNWTDADKGQLRISTPSEFIDIYPIENRAVIFRSKLTVHEVIECHKGRWALTIWLRKSSN